MNPTYSRQFKNQKCWAFNQHTGSLLNPSLPACNHVAIPQRCPYAHPGDTQWATAREPRTRPHGHRPSRGGRDSGRPRMNGAYRSPPYLRSVDRSWQSEGPEVDAPFRRFSHSPGSDHPEVQGRDGRTSGYSERNIRMDRPLALYYQQSGRYSAPAVGKRVREENEEDYGSPRGRLRTQSPPPSLQGHFTRFQRSPSISSVYDDDKRTTRSIPPRQVESPPTNSRSLSRTPPRVVEHDLPGHSSGQTAHLPPVISNHANETSLLTPTTSVTALLPPARINEDRDFQLHDGTSDQIRLDGLNQHEARLNSLASLPTPPGSAMNESSRAPPTMWKRRKLLVERRQRIRGNLQETENRREELHVIALQPIYASDPHAQRDVRVIDEQYRDLNLELYDVESAIQLLDKSGGHTSAAGVISTVHHTKSSARIVELEEHVRALQEKLDNVPQLMNDAIQGALAVYDQAGVEAVRSPLNQRDHSLENLRQQFSMHQKSLKRSLIEIRKCAELGIYQQDSLSVLQTNISALPQSVDRLECGIVQVANPSICEPEHAGSNDQRVVNMGHFKIGLLHCVSEHARVTLRMNEQVLKWLEHC